MKKRTMIFKNLRSGSTIEDVEFDHIYPEDLRETAEIHFTPVEVSKIAAQYLVEKPGARILDIGSGTGKFCMVGSVCTDGYFTGVEQRGNLCNLADRISSHYQLANVEFIHANITEIRFKDYDAFYLFNPFYENICMSGAIDDTIELDRQLYNDYCLYVRRQLDEMPAGTKLATYFSYLDEVPLSYQVQSTGMDGKLKMWEKMR